MSRIIDFLRQLTPSFTKDELKEKLRLVGQAIQQTLASLVTAAEVLGKPSFKSRVGKAFDADFKRSVKTRFRGTAAEVMTQIIQSLDSLASLLTGVVDKTYNAEVTVDGITYKRAEVLRILGYMDFTVTYARQLLHYLLVCEANVQAKTLTEGRERPKPEIEWLEKNQGAFFQLLNTFSQEPRDVIKAIEGIPDISVGDNDEITLHPTVGIGRLDPLKSNFVPGVTPMFMSIGIWWAQRQVARYERLKEDLRAIEYRVEQLRLQAQGKEDAQLEKTIVKYEQYIDDLAEDIAKMEKKYK